MHALPHIGNFIVV